MQAKRFCPILHAAPYPTKSVSEKAMPCNLWVKEVVYVQSGLCLCLIDSSRQAELW